MREHPSRLVVLRVKPGEEASLSERVFAQCWIPFGGRQQICCEQIEITTTEAGLKDVPAVVRALKRLTCRWSYGRACPRNTAA